jgi:hypothetical protein
MQNRWPTLVNARNRTQCDRSRLEHLAYQHMLEQTQITQPVCTEIEATHGMTQVWSHKAPTTI